MLLNSELISQFVKTTKDTVSTKKESTVYGTIVRSGDSYFVKIDGSELLTPITTTTDIVSGERVTVMIKNHTATVTGNITSPAARNRTVEQVTEQLSEANTTLGTKVSDTSFTTEVNRLDARIDEVDLYAASIGQNVLKNAEDITKLQGVELYFNESGSAETITLSDSITNYTYVEIYFTDINIKTGGYTKVWNPNGKSVCLHMQEPGLTSSITRQTEYVFTDTEMIPTLETAGYIQFTNGTSPAVVIGENQLKIIRVIGLV